MSFADDLIRKAEHRADDGKRQIPAVFGHEINLRLSLQPIEKPISRIVSKNVVATV